MNNVAILAAVAALAIAVENSDSAESRPCAVAADRHPSSFALRWLGSGWRLPGGRAEAGLAQGFSALSGNDKENSRAVSSIRDWPAQTFAGLLQPDPRFGLRL